MKTSLIIGTVCIAILIFVLMLWFLFKFQSVYFEDYFDSNFEVSYNGDVKDIKRNRGFVYVELDNGEKYNISDSYNYSYKTRSLYSFLDIGDFVNKPKDTDSIFIVKGGREYFFLLGKNINKR